MLLLAIELELETGGLVGARMPGATVGIMVSPGGMFAVDKSMFATIFYALFLVRTFSPLHFFFLFFSLCLFSPFELSAKQFCVSFEANRVGARECLRSIARRDV